MRLRRLRTVMVTERHMPQIVAEVKHEGAEVWRWRLRIGTITIATNIAYSENVARNEARDAYRKLTELSASEWVRFTEVDAFDE